MPDAWEDFNNSYIKGMFKNKSFSSPFNPDGAYGANMVPGSQNMNPAPNRNALNALSGMFGGGQTTKPTDAMTSEGRGLTMPAGTNFSDMTNLSHVPVTDLGPGYDPTGLAMGLAPGLMRHLFGGTAGSATGGALGVAKTGMDTAGAIGGNPMSMASLPFDLINNVGFLRKLFR